ncbi:O-antigen polymerase [Bradyrhizobium sp. 168]|nr:O-antigen polymerase [Bradyrhizobium sp. 168]
MFGGAWVLLNAIGIVIPYVYVTNGDPVFLANKVGVQQYIDGALWCLLGGNAAFFLGYLFASTHVRTIRQLPKNIREAGIAPGVAIWVAFFLSLFVLLAASGDLTQNIFALLRKTRSDVEGQSFIYLFLAFLTFQSVLLSLSSIRTGKNARVAIVLALLTMIAAFACGSRVRAALCLAIPAAYQAVYKGIRLKYVVIGVASVVGILAAGAMIRSSVQTVESSGTLDEQLFASMSLLDPTAMSLAMVERFSPKVMESISTLIFWNIPKSLIGEKTLIASVLARYTYFGDVAGGITLGLYGEVFYYFGAFALLVGCAGLGFVVRTLVLRSVSDSFAGRVYFLIVYFFLFSSLRNGLFIDLLSYAIIGVLALLNRGVADLFPRKRP